MTFYQRVFHFREQYQIIADGEFIQNALLSKIHLQEECKALLLGNVKLMTTPCVIAWLKQQGDIYFGAYVAGKRFEQRRCGHVRVDRPCLSPKECIMSIIGETNRVKCIIGTQDLTLQSVLKNIPGIPTLHIYRATLILDDIPDISKQFSTTFEQEQLKPSERERKLIQAIAPVSAAVPSISVKKKRQPNPLSMRKSSQKFKRASTKPTSK